MMMNLKNLVVVTALYLFSVSGAQAGHSAGNGGNGIEVGGTLYVLDLVEAGIEKGVYFKPTLTPEPRFQATAQLLFGGHPEAAALVARKLSELALQDRWTATIFRQAFEMYAWRWVEMDLVSIDDSDGSDLKLPKDSLYQLAVRDGQTIRIDKKLWERLDANQQAALLFHEAIYAFFPGESRRAREAIGVLFSQDVERGPEFLDMTFNPAGSAIRLKAVRTISELDGYAAGALPVLESKDGTLRPSAPFGARTMAGIFDPGKVLSRFVYTGLKLDAVDGDAICQSASKVELDMEHDTELDSYYRMAFYKDTGGHTYLALDKYFSNSTDGRLTFLVGNQYQATDYGQDLLRLLHWQGWSGDSGYLAKCAAFLNGLSLSLNPLLR